MNQTLSIVPSLPAQSLAELITLRDALADTVHELQVDIVDGHFAPPISWPFTEREPAADLIAGLKELDNSEELFLEVDCMVMHPEQYLDALVAAGVHRVVVHMGSTERYEEILAHGRTHKYALGLAMTNDVPLPAILPRLKEVDFVQVMGIERVGQQGQPFDERTLKTVELLRSADEDLEIAVDGAVNQETIVALRQAGVNRFCPGSAIAKAAQPAKAYRDLLELVAHRA